MHDFGGLAVGLDRCPKIADRAFDLLDLRAGK
jgi:hypothetical protein